MTGHNKLNFVFPWTKMAMNWQKLKIAEFSWIKEFLYSSLTHWGRMTHICISTLTIIGSDNGLSPRRRQAIIWTNAGILLIGPLGPNIRENLIEILTFSFTKMYLKMLSTKWRPFCLSLNVLTSLDSWTKHSSPKWPLKCNHIKLRNIELGYATHWTWCIHRSKTWVIIPGGGGGGGGGYSLCDGWYICAAVLTPFFHFGRIEHDLFGVFFSSTNSKAIFWGTKTTNFYKNRSFWPQIQFFPRSFWVQFSAASGTPPSVFRPSTPPGSLLVQVMACYLLKYQAINWTYDDS